MVSTRTLLIVLAIAINITLLTTYSAIFYATSEKMFRAVTGKPTAGYLGICIDWFLNLSEVPKQTARANHLFQLDINVSNEEMYYPYLNYTDNTTLFDINRTTGMISFTPTDAQAGNHSINITVGNNACREPDDSMVFNLEIKRSNYAPRIDMPNQTNLTEGVFFYLNVSVYASDPDNDTLKFYDNYPGFVIGEDTGIIAFTPGDDDVGNHTVRIYVVDPGFLTDYQDVLFSIANVNDAPNLTPIGSQTAYINISLNITLSAYDPDPNEALTFSSNTSWFLNSSGKIPTDNRWSYYTVSLLFTNYTEWFNTTHFINITVNDTEGAEDSEVISLTILKYNHPPNITSYYPLEKEPTIYKGSCQFFNITKEDIDGTIPSTQWFVDDTFTGTVEDNYTFCPTAISTYNVTVVITDGELNDSESWLVTVKEPPPTVRTVPSGTISPSMIRLVCEELWVCSDWSTCPESEVQIRECKDLHNCGTTKNKPKETQKCTFVPVPSCFDGIKNQDEVLPDCGGSICPPCPTCDDGIQNQGEEGIDCGGPCPVCKEVVAPVEVKKVPFMLRNLFIDLNAYWLFWLILSLFVLSSIRIAKEFKVKVPIAHRLSMAIQVAKVNRLLAKAYEEVKAKRYDRAQELYNKAKSLYIKLPKEQRFKVKIKR